MTNLLTNGGFEGGAGRATFNGQAYGEISVPLGWTAFWDETKSRPEMKVIGAVAPYLDPQRVAEGKQAVQWFSFYRDHDAGLYQRVSVPAGATLYLSALAHVWYSQRDDPHKSEYHYDSAPDTWYRFDDGQPGLDVGVGIDPTGGTDWTSPAVVWTWKSYYDEPWALKVEVPDCGPTVTVFLRSVTRWPFKHCDAYWDDAVLEVLDAPDPEPECRGLPRGGPGGYVRTVNVIPQDATPERAEDIFAMAWANGRQTVTGSYDDAGIGDLAEKTAVLWDIPTAEQSQYLEFYQQYYPGTRVVFQGDTGGAVEPEPPVGGEPTAYPDPGVLIGLHSQRTKDGWLDYYRRTKAAVFKGFTVAQCVAAKQASPDTLVVFRRHVDNDGAYINAPDLVASARALLDLYAAEFAGYSASSGMSVSDILKHIDVLESVNEVIGTRDPELEPSVAFDVAFADAIRLRYGHQVSAGLLTVAVGNPHESEVVNLLPAARKAYEDGHYIGYHPYWSANTERSWLAEKWQWHAGRWCEWDRVFTTHGVYPRYYGGEGGICFAPDGDSFQASRGWKSCGAFGKYITDLVLFDRLARAWNATHGNRFRGMAVFCYGGWGWEDFDFEPGDLAELEEALE